MRAKKLQRSFDHFSRFHFDQFLFKIHPKNLLYILLRSIISNTLYQYRKKPNRAPFVHYEQIIFFFSLFLFNKFLRFFSFPCFDFFFLFIFILHHIPVRCIWLYSSRNSLREWKRLLKY